MAGPPIADTRKKIGIEPMSSLEVKLKDHKKACENLHAENRYMRDYLDRFPCKTESETPHVPEYIRCDYCNRDTETHYKDKLCPTCENCGASIAETVEKIQECSKAVQNNARMIYYSEQMVTKISKMIAMHEVSRKEDKDMQTMATVGVTFWSCMSIIVLLLFVVIVPVVIFASGL